MPDNDEKRIDVFNVELDKELGGLQLDELPQSTNPNEAPVLPNEDISKQAWLQRVYKYRKKNCEACGIGGEMQIHHIDGNYRNANPENLQTLCIWCHRFLHHTAKRLGLKEPGRLAKLFESDSDILPND